MATKINERMVLVGAVLVVIISVIITSVFWQYRFGAFGDGDGSGGERNITFTDAVLTCQEDIRGKFGAELIGLSVDDHSSRYEHKTNRYKLFFNTNVHSKRSESGQLHLAVYCFVRADHGQIIHFEQVEQRENGEAAPSGGKSLFGWP